MIDRMKLAKFCDEIVTKMAFLNTKGTRTNSMTISWIGSGYFWNMDVVILAIRHSRFTHEQMKTEDDITISLGNADLRNALKYCGEKSGRNEDKILACGEEYVPARTVNVPVVKGADGNIEGKIVAKFESSDDNNIADGLLQVFYSDIPRDAHTFYFVRVSDIY